MILATSAQSAISPNYFKNFNNAKGGTRTPHTGLRILKILDQLREFGNFVREHVKTW